jgi:hypothetical protein
MSLIVVYRITPCSTPVARQARHTRLTANTREAAESWASAIKGLLRQSGVGLHAQGEGTAGDEQEEDASYHTRLCP